MNKSFAEFPQTIAGAIRAQALYGPERSAIVCAGLPAFSFRELDRKIKQIGDELRAAGIGASSRIGVVLPFGPEAAVVAIAVSAHAIGFPLNPALTVDEFEFELTRADLDAVVFPGWTDLPMATLARIRSIGIFHASRANRSLAEIRLEQVVEVPTARKRSGAPSSHSVFVIQVSSGSTGTPKLILVTHANLFDIVAKMQTWFGLSRNDRCACILPIYAGFGFKIGLLAPLLIGGSVALAKTQQPEDIAVWSSDLNPTWFVATPTYLRAALDKLRAVAGGKVANSLRFFASTSAYLPEAVRSGLEATLGIPGLEYYGMGEAGIIAANPAPPATRKPGSVGLISPDVAILNSDGEVLPRGAAGAIAVRGQGVSPGYIEALPPGCDTLPDTDSSPNEWALTGDLGVVDADGFLSIVGRTKEIINRGGTKISPYEVEKALLQHPAVREAGAFAVPHPRLGENVAASVVLQPNVEATSTELQHFLHAHLAAFKVPQHIEIVNSIPKSHTGKVLRTELADATMHREQRIDPPETPLEFHILEIWQRLLQRADIGVHDDFIEKGGDSLLAVGMLCEVERLTGQTISNSVLLEDATIRQLAQKLSEGGGLQPKPLIQLSSNGSQMPLIFFHGDVAGGGYYAARLAELLGPDQPLIVVAPHGLGGETIPRSIEAMAVDRLPLIKNAQPQGPYRLAGWCIGGVVAFEVARLLVAGGEKVEMVAMIDSPTVNAYRSVQTLLSILGHARPVGGQVVERAMAWTWRHIANFDSLPMSQRWARVKVAAQSLVAAGHDRARITFGGDGPAGSHAIEIVHQRDRTPRFASAMSNYFPAPLSVRVICFSAEYDARAWSRISSALEVIKLPGDHGSMTNNPAELAQHLDILLRKESEENPH